MTNGRGSPPPAAPPLPAAPRRKSPPRGGPAGPGGGRPRYVMQVAAKDGQLLSSVVRTLTTQSSPFNDRPMCRICHEGSSQEDLLSPCECMGTLGTIHRSCLEHWLSSSNTRFCELCHFRFAVERKPRPLVEWLRNPGPQHEKRTLFGDMVCFLFITPLATVSGWLCLRGAVDHLHFSSRLEAVGLIALTVALFTIYLFWTLVSFRYHCRLYNEWRRTNQRVILLAPKSANIPSNQQSLLGLPSVKRNSKETIV
ncbi:E3 ubiquitin-protein ligase MARCHF3 isoform X1 [Tympanuchus pallidicinctus]|uniref:E3 ubiquitin-protein ligase MARCHF3 isoform X1 n=1 Tax=Tympanuchus pallidicinctus TaxID=109042 RepID=UPI002286F5A1|nr:E3 ubiquitin-protein ligase MARCHF3 isoform X1 [Tympanuchus pallidicinctus]